MKSSTKALFERLWNEPEKPVELPKTMPLSGCYIKQIGQEHVDGFTIVKGKYHTYNHGILKSLKGWEWSVDAKHWTPCV